MEDMEQQLERNKPKNGFWKGVFCGALACSLVCAIVLGVSGEFGKKEDDIPAEPTKEESLVSDETADKLKNIRSIIDRTYLYSDKIDEKTLQDSIVRGYVAGLNEPYTVYYDEKETTALVVNTTGTFGGIGVVRW